MTMMIGNRNGRAFRTGYAWNS